MDVTISKKTLDHLNREVLSLKNNVRLLLDQNDELLQNFNTVQQLEQERDLAVGELEKAACETQHWKSRYEALLAEMETLKQDQYRGEQALEEVSGQLSQQTDYCASMGAASCTLLWRVSRCEEAIPAILVGTKVEEFLSMVISTLQSYSQTYLDETAPQDESDETQFVLALCGILTNLAASPFGRDFLMKMEGSQQLVKTLVDSLFSGPDRKSAKLKDLILMALYNLSINQKGLQMLSSTEGILQLLVDLLQDTDHPDVCLNSLRLAQSLVYDAGNSHLFIKLKQMMDPQLLQKLTKHRHSDISACAEELIEDFKHTKDH